MEKASEVFLRSNDGGVIVSLFFMMATLYLALVASVGVYVYVHRKDASESPVHKFVRILSGMSNLGNAIVHLLLIVYIQANEGNGSAYWKRERELEADGIGGPVFLTIFNCAAGLCSINNVYPKVPLVWNTFVIVAGICLPLVWLRFLEEGFATWPYFIVFVWLAIFFFELSSFATVWTYHSIKPAEDVAATKSDETARKKKDDDYVPVPTSTKEILVLISTLSTKPEQKTAQDRALTILKGLSLGDRLKTLDGADPAQKERRNELFGLSGLRAKYPQFFVVDEGQTTFLADWEGFEAMHESGTLKAALQ